MGIGRIMAIEDGCSTDGRNCFAVVESQEKQAQIVFFHGSSKYIGFTPSSPTILPHSTALLLKLLPVENMFFQRLACEHSDKQSAVLLVR